MVGVGDIAQLAHPMVDGDKRDAIRRSRATFGQRAADSRHLPIVRSGFDTDKERVGVAALCREENEREKTKNSFHRSWELVRLISKHRRCRLLVAARRKNPYFCGGEIRGLGRELDHWRRNLDEGPIEHLEKAANVEWLGDVSGGAEFFESLDLAGNGIR